MMWIESLDSSGSSTGAESTCTARADAARSSSLLVTDLSTAGKKASNTTLNWLKHNMFVLYNADVVKMKNIGSKYMAWDRNIFLPKEFTWDVDRKDIVS